jgi:signal transduction histidine kinase
MIVGSLRLRFLIVGVLSVTLALGASAGGLVFLFKRHVERRVESELNVYLNQLVAGVDRTPTGEIMVATPPGDPRFERPLSGLYWQITVEPSGNVLRSRSLWDAELALPPAPEHKMRRHRLTGPGGATLYLVERHYDLPARFEGASIRAVAGLDTGEIRESVSDFMEDLIPFLLVIGGALLTAGWAQVAVGLRPLVAVRERLASIRSGRLQRLGPGFPHEIQPLAAEIDALLDARDHQVGKARARSADLAHALKTPLQVLAGEAERLQAKGEREIAAEILNLTSVMHRQVERELTRTRIAADPGHTRADVRQVAERVIDVVRRTPNGQNVTWEIDIPDYLAARIDADDLAELLGNLIENAARHAVLRVQISGTAHQDHVLVSIADDGPGIPAERRAEALRRGGRLDVSSSNTGLGLAIVSDIAEAWGATLSLEDAKPGLRANLRFALS